MKTSDRVIYFDILNIYACFCVICLHCNGVVHYLYKNLHVWYQALFVEVVCYWAVPIFLMLTGATLLTYNEKYSTKIYFTKRFKRTVIPWLFWSVVMFVLLILKGTIEKEAITISNFISMLLTNKIETIYWYFPMLFAIYLAIPVFAQLRKIPKHKELFWYMFWMAFTTYSVLPLLCKFLNISWNSALSFPITGGGYILFVVLGYLLSTEEIKKKHRYMVYVSALGSILFRYCGTVFLSAQAGEIDKTLFGYTQFHSVILAAAVFLMAKEIPWEKCVNKFQIGGVLSRVSACSLGIYLIHMLVIRGIRYVVPIDVALWEWRVLAPFVIYTISLLIVLILKKIKGIRNIVP